MRNAITCVNFFEFSHRSLELQADNQNGIHRLRYCRIEILGSLNLRTLSESRLGMRKLILSIIIEYFRNPMLDHDRSLIQTR